MESTINFDVSGYEEAAMAWALTQKRVTNAAIRKRFGVDEAYADVIYDRLKAAGIIGCGGYVQEEEKTTEGGTS